MGDKHLMRVIYQTDATTTEPDYLGSFSGTIPASAFINGAEIVNVDWSHRGWVEVTYLSPGGHRHDGNVPYEEVPPAESQIRALAHILRSNMALQSVYVDDEMPLDDTLVDGTADFIKLARAVLETEGRWRT